MRADTFPERSITLVGLPPEEALQIRLLGEILGWRVKTASATGEPRLGLGQGEGLVVRMVGGTIRVETDDVAVSRQLAALGLDRLVPPVPLAALEELLVFAG